MTSSTSGVRILGISGSLRKGSCNTAILEALRQRLAKQGTVEMSVFSLESIPLYNSDLDGETPLPAVRALRQAIQASAGIVLSSPEYNHGMSGVLKNALDWASRPVTGSPLKGKPALIITSSPGATGGVRAQYQVRETLVSACSRVVITPEIVIPLVFQKMADGAFVDETSLSFAAGGIQNLLAEISRSSV
jgi:chromate reductase